VVTPEAVPLELRAAGIGSRFLALVLDWLVQGALALALVLGLLPFADAVPRGVGVALLFVLIALVTLGYPVILETLWRGRTVGKAAVGLRVVTTEGAPVRFRHALVRGALSLVELQLTFGTAAVVAVLLSRDNRRLGDLAAGTLVLRERSGLRAPEAVHFGVPPTLAAYAATLDVRRVRPDEYQLIRTFLLRSATMRPDARHHLAVGLATPLASRIVPPPPAGADAETFLVAVAAGCQANSGAETWASGAVPPVPSVPPVVPAAPPPAPPGDAWGAPPVGPPVDPPERPSSAGPFSPLA